MQLELFNQQEEPKKTQGKKLSKRERDWITRSFLKKTGNYPKKIGSTRKSN